MNKSHGLPRFFFSLPRLLAHWRGQNASRTEQNWLEANIVGTAIHLVFYVFVFELLARHLSTPQQLLLVIPLAFLVWIFWSLALYFNSRIIWLLRKGGVMRDLSDSRAQGILIGIMTTCFASWLISIGSWSQVIGILWIGAVILNLFAAVLLTASNADSART